MRKIINISPFTYLPVFNDSTRVMFKLITLMVREEGKWKVYLNSNVRDKIMKECNVSRSSYNRTINLLKKNKFLEIHKEILILNLPDDCDIIGNI